jgi:hypothetical protein
MLNVTEIAFICYAVTDMAVSIDSNSNSICIHKRKAND